MPVAGEILIEAIDELLSEGAPTRRGLTLLPPRFPSEYKMCQLCSSIRISLTNEREELRVMSASCQASMAILEFTDLGLRHFRKAMVDWCDGAEDFGMGPEHPHRAGDYPQLGAKDLASDEIWFWSQMLP